MAAAGAAASPAASIATSLVCALASSLCTFLAMRRRHARPPPPQRPSSSADPPAAEPASPKGRSLLPVFAATAAAADAEQQRTQQRQQQQYHLDASGLPLCSPINVVKRSDPYDPSPRRGCAGAAAVGWHGARGPTCSTWLHACRADKGISACSAAVCAHALALLQHVLNTGPVCSPAQCRSRHLPLLLHKQVPIVG